MGPRLRKLALTVHVALSVAWPGSVAAYLALALASMTSGDLLVVRSAYLAMDLVARYVIVPLAVATLLSGILMSLGTKWGLFQHYWTLISLLLTLLAVVVLFVQLGEIARLAEAARVGGDTLPGAGGQVFHAAAGLVVLLVVLVLNVYKPRGRTAYGRRRRRSEDLRRAVDPGP